MSKYERIRLRSTLELADSGTWGDEATPQTGVPVLRSSNIQNDKLDLSDVAWRLVPQHDLARCKLQNGDIIVTKSSGSADLIGKCCIHEATDCEYYFSNFTLRLRVNQSVATPQWIFHWLTSAPGRARLAALNNTTTGLRNLNIDRYLDQELPLPSMKEQYRLTAILAKADNILRKRREAVALTKRYLGSTFREMFGNLVENDMMWPTVSLHNLTIDEIRNGISPASSGATPGTVLTLSAITGDRFDPNAVKDAFFGVAALPADKRVHADLFLVCRGNGNLNLVGAGRFPRHSMPGVVFPDTMIALPLDLGRISKNYLDALWQTPLIRAQVEKAARTTNGTYKINQASLLAITFPLPPLENQMNYDRICHSMPFVALGMSLREAEDLFSSLSHHAFTGQL